MKTSFHYVQGALVCVLAVLASPAQAMVRDGYATGRSSTW
jgi:hypothetical protein